MVEAEVVGRAGRDFWSGAYIRMKRFVTAGSMCSGRCERMDCKVSVPVTRIERDSN